MPDAIVLLKNDHKDVERLFKQFERLGDRAYVSKRKVVDEIIEALSVHAALEEQHFYPAVREQSTDIEADVLEGLEEHHIVKWTLSELADLDPEHERFDAKVTVLIESVRHHVEEEEGEMFPAVRAALGRKALQDLGEVMQSAKRSVPVAPHPKAPDEPPANLAAAAGVVVLDRAKRRLGRRLR
ncbi:MAG: hemerythrin domain-containing protein [Mycobacteriales bacterium]